MNEVSRGFATFGCKTLSSCQVYSTQVDIGFGGAQVQQCQRKLIVGVHDAVAVAASVAAFSPASQCGSLSRRSPPDHGETTNH